METTNGKKEVQRFKKVFRKGEQICIFGVNWDTHGYITAIEEDGVTLTQLNNIRGIKYNWNCFEIICHAGFKVWKSKLTEVTNIFEFKISTHLPTYRELKNLPKEVKSIIINKIFITKSPLYFSTSLPLKPKEVLPGWMTDHEYEKGYLKRRVPKNEFNRRIYLNFKIGKYGNVYTYQKASSSYPGWTRDENFNAEVLKTNEVILFPPIVTKNINYIISPLHVHDNTPQENYAPTISRDGYESIYFTAENLKRLRTNNWDKRTAIGDPYIIEADPVGYKTWKNDNGFAYANNEADIYL